MRRPNRPKVGAEPGGVGMTAVSATVRRMISTVTAVTLLALGAAVAAAPAVADLAAPTGTGPQSGSHAVTAPPTPVLTGLAPGGHAAYDRVVVTFDGAIPSWQVAYGAVQNGASGQPRTLAGSATLRVDLRPAQAHSSSGSATVPADQHPNLPTLREVAVTEDFEGVVILGLGLSSRVGFRVFELTGPNRLVIDVAHVATAAAATPVSGPAAFTG